MPRVPKTASTLLMLATVISNISKMRLRLETLSSTGFVRAAATANQAFAASPSANGTNINRNSEALRNLHGVD